MYTKDLTNKSVITNMYLCCLKTFESGQREGSTVFPVLANYQGKVSWRFNSVVECSLSKHKDPGSVLSSEKILLSLLLAMH